MNYQDYEEWISAVTASIEASNLIFVSEADAMAEVLSNHLAEVPHIQGWLANQIDKVQHSYSVALRHASAGELSTLRQMRNERIKVVQAEVDRVHELTFSIKDCIAGVRLKALHPNNPTRLRLSATGNRTRRRMHTTLSAIESAILPQ